MSALYPGTYRDVKPAACAPEGWQPPMRGYDDEDPRRELRIERQARQVAKQLRDALEVTR
ncbi:MAG: hypothetical protein MOGMAGMI_02446 [Candidatus Omnitrophica bacterium]|nr:hypothetical protein [Candidatus Omnitrophota bacterium]